MIVFKRNHLRNLEVINYQLRQLTVYYGCFSIYFIVIKRVPLFFYSCQMHLVEYKNTFPSEL